MILSKKRFSYDEEFYLSSMNPQFKADFMNHLYSTFDLFAAHSPESTLLADEPPEGYSSLLEAVKHPRWQDEETDII
jgi:alpha-amylase/alpha-mannosidase (GH57 family)